MSEDTRHFQTLLQQVQQGSQEAARELADTYGPYVRRYVRRTLNSSLRQKFDSIDFVQLVWASFFTEPKGLPPLESPEHLVGYLAGMARHKVLNTGRHMQTQKHDVQREVRLDCAGHATEPHLASRDPTPSSVAIFHEEWERLVEDQPEKVRRIIELRFAGNTYEEIACALAIHERTVRKIIDKVVARRQGQTRDLQAGQRSSGGRSPEGRSTDERTTEGG
jgi:RNA polymerase sigma-70 factor (ECF subfamily)